MRNIAQLPKQGFRDFDLPVEHLAEERHYVPPRTHDKSEEARRRELNHGTLLREMQERGLRVARTILENIEEEEGRIFATDLIGLAGINTAWYSYASARSDVMRRRLKLPLMAHPRNRDAVSVYGDSIEMLKKAENKARLVVEANEFVPEKRGQRQKEIGVSAGNTALHLLMFAPVSRGEFPMPYPDEDEILPSEEEMQVHVRRIALSGLSRSRDAYKIVGAHPSIAQLADPYSHLSVYWHRRAPGSAQSALRDSQSIA